MRKIEPLTEHEYQALLKLMDGGFRYHGIDAVTSNTHNVKFKIMAAISVPEKVTKVKSVEDISKD